MKEKTAKNILKKVTKDYEKICDEFDISRRYNWKEFKYIINFIDNKEKIVDLGCGNGRFYKFLKKNKNTEYLGIDNCSSLIQKAKQDQGPHFKEGNLLDIPLGNESMDTAISIAAFHHLPGKKYRKKALEEIKRILKKDGKLIISVWNLFQKKYKKYIWKSRIKHYLSLGKYDLRDTFIPWGKSGINRYYYAFRPKEIEKLLTKNGFKIIDKQLQKNFVYICRKK